MENSLYNLRVIFDLVVQVEREFFSFFASFFLFSKEKKKRNSLRNHLYTKDDKQINLQTPYLRNLTTCTRKHLNINTTNTGKGSNRRWQAPGGQRSTSEFRRTVSTWLPQKVHFTEKFPARSPHAPHFHPLTAAKRQKSTAPSCTSCRSVLYY